MLLQITKSVFMAGLSACCAVSLALMPVPASCQDAVKTSPEADKTNKEAADKYAVPDPKVQAAAADVAAAVKNRPIGDKWALIVGISEFASNKVPQLKYSAKDARDFYNYLIKEAHFAPDHVRILLNEKATQRRILSELGSKGLPRLVREDDLLVLFFSTHGSPSQMDTSGSNFLLAYDTDPDDLYPSGVEMQDVFHMLSKRLHTDRVLMVLDACHSGSLDPNAKGLTRSSNFDTEQIALGSGQMVICSSEQDEQSWESKRYKNGVFTKNLLDVLRGNPNGTITSNFEKMKSTVSNEVQEDYPGASQKPVLRSKWSGNDIVLATLPSAPRIIPQTVMVDLEPDSSNDVRASIGGGNTGSGATNNPVKLPPQTVIGSIQSPTKNDQRSVLKLTTTFFSNEINPKTAYTEACRQQAAHFNEPEYYYRKARILMQLGNFSKADQELKGLLVDAPNNSMYHLARAYCYHRLGNKFGAEDELSMAKFHDPSLPRDIQFGD